MAKFIEARFQSHCAETGSTIKKDDSILYDTVTKKAYCSQSRKYKDEASCRNIAAMVEAQENAYYDNFCITNNI